MKYRFRIEYYDPKADLYMDEQMDFEDASGVSAYEWAEDAAYTAADKHWHRVTCLRQVKE